MPYYTPPAPVTADLSTTPIGGIGQVFRSGTDYKAVGEVVKRADYPALNAAFPPNGAVSASLKTIPEFALAGTYAAYGNGIFVMIGHNGNSVNTAVCLISRDGLNWFPSTLPAAASWKGILFANGKFIVWGGGVTVYMSTDGITWTSGTLTFTPAAIAYGAGKYVAVEGGTTKAAHSTDGASWTDMTLPTSPGNPADVVTTFGNGTFIISGSASLSLTSTNGTTWTQRAVPVPLYYMAFGNGMFMAACYNQDKTAVFTSTDGINWTRRLAPFSNATAGIKNIIFGDNVFIIVNNVEGVAATPDGVTWTPRIAWPTNGGGLRAYGAGIAVGGVSTTSIAVVYAEGPNSEYLHLSGTAGQFVRVK